MPAGNRLIAAIEGQIPLKSRVKMEKCRIGFV